LEMSPPGHCACKLSGVPARQAAHLLGGEEMPLPAEPEDDDHDPGCPASPLSAALGLKPADVPQHAIAFVAPSLDITPDAPALEGVDRPQALPLAWPPEPHFYLTHCSFLL